MYQSTKILELGSCAFRQPNASSHCRYLHGYRLTAKFWFEAKELDENNWVVDFGSLKELKGILREQFDHTTCIDYSDPHVETFKQLAVDGVCDLRLMQGVGIEKFAEWCYFASNRFIAGITENRCHCVKVEVFEHEDNSAICCGDVVREAPPINLDEEEEPVKPPVTPESKKKAGGDLTKPPFKKKDNSAVDIKPRKQQGKWIDPESTWGL